MAFPEIREIKKIIDMLQKTDVAEIELTQGNESVRITRSNGHNASFPMQPMMNQAPVMPHHSVIPAATPAPVAIPTITAQENTVAAIPVGHTVHSPMVGTYYGSA